MLFQYCRRVFTTSVVVVCVGGVLTPDEVLLCGAVAAVCALPVSSSFQETLSKKAGKPAEEESSHWKLPAWFRVEVWK